MFRAGTPMESSCGCRQRVHQHEGRAIGWGGRRRHKHWGLVSRRGRGPCIYQRGERIVPICFGHAEFLRSVRGTSLSLSLQPALRSARGCVVLSWWEDPYTERTIPKRSLQDRG